ncbi:hypothetical protein ACLMAJ_17870 [Nocardia sp. KC 131]|uniref:hypothetical protein n=1 Tax=Nocardia arseniciresistens TaxID=3392119 RepID=UPI00398E84B8
MTNSRSRVVLLCTEHGVDVGGEVVVGSGEVGVEAWGARAGLRALSGTADFGDNSPYSPLRSLLSRLVADSPGPNHTIALLRGAQAA